MIQLKDITTMKIGGTPGAFYEVATKEELENAVKEAHAKGLALMPFGEGSNMVPAEELSHLAFIKLKNNEVKEEDQGDTVLVTVGAGMNWDAFVEYVVSHNLQGVECLSYIPGAVGGAVVQNIGAYGQEVRETLQSVTVYDVVKNTWKTFSKSECEFEYRGSVFKHNDNVGKYFVYEATFKLAKDTLPKLEYKSLLDFMGDEGIEPTSLSAIREGVVGVRKKRLLDPSETPNSGSFFKNPVITKAQLATLQKKYEDIPFVEVDDEKVKLYAAWLIEHAGWKGKKYKDVAVSDKHALILVNPEGKGTSSQIFELAQQISDDIEKKFGVNLEREIKTIK